MSDAGIGLAECDLVLLAASHPHRRDLRSGNYSAAEITPTAELLSALLSELPDSHPIRIWWENDEYPGFPKDTTAILAMCSWLSSQCGMSRVECEDQIRLAPHGTWSKLWLGSIFREEERQFRDRLLTDAQGLIFSSPLEMSQQIVSVVKKEMGRRTISMRCEIPVFRAWTCHLANRLWDFESLRLLTDLNKTGAILAHEQLLRNLAQSSSIRDEELCLWIASKRAIDPCPLDVVLRGDFHVHFLPQHAEKLGLKVHIRHKSLTPASTDADPLRKYYLQNFPSSNEQEGLLLIEQCFLRGLVFQFAPEHPELIKKILTLGFPELDRWMSRMNNWLNTTGITSRLLQENSRDWLMSEV